MSGWQRYTDSHQLLDIVRFHPKTSSTESVTHNLTQVCNQTQNVIYLYPGQDQMLLMVNNYFTKIWSNWWKAKLFDQSLVYNNWPVDPTVPVDQAPNWVKREFLSFYLFPAWLDQVEWYHPDCYQFPKNCILVTVDSLLYDPKTVVTQIKQHCGLQYKKSFEQLALMHTTMLSQQQHLHKDEMCADILQATLSNVDLNWPDLSLVDEAWLQWSLRKQGLELHCHGLDTFPTNSLQLRKLLYSV